MTIRLLLDRNDDEGVPVGVAAWDAAREWFGVKLLEQGQQGRRIPRGRLALARVAVRDLQRWATARSVPYGESGVDPWTSDFWLDAHQHLASGVRLGEPVAMEPMADPEAELPLLFEAVAKPRVRETARRIDGYLNRAIGRRLGYHLVKRQHVVAFEGREETVRRAAQGPTGLVLIDGVNLAVNTGRRDADAIVSKMRRVLEEQHEAHLLIGYVASPGGLNGEADMLAWIRQELTEHAFNLVRERSAFRLAAARALADVGLDVTPTLDEDWSP
jgi:hypothetical protein